MKREKVTYKEPTDYIPEDVRKELKLGEYAEQEEDENTRFRDYVNSND